MGASVKLAFLLFWPLTLANSNLQFTNLEIGLTGSEEVADGVLKSMDRRVERATFYKPVHRIILKEVPDGRFLSS